MRKEARRSKRAAFSDGTNKNLLWQWKLFIMFCIYFKFKLLPASIECLCLYAQFLSRSMKSANSVRNYIGGVHTLHLLCEVPYSGKGNVELKLTLRGIARLKPHMQRQAAPLSPNILLRMRQFLDLETVVDCTMWALMLLAFFTMSRKSNLVVTGSNMFDPSKQLCRSDIQVGSKGLLVTYRWSKTNQFGQRVHVVPIIAMPGSPLCPVTAYRAMLELCPGNPVDPAFFIKGATGPHSKKPVSYYLLQKYIKTGVARLGLDPALFSSHSLRRAGASWAFQAQVPSELIKSHGDWASQAYLRYLDFTLSERLVVAERMCGEIDKLF